MTAPDKPRKLSRREVLKIGGGALLGSGALLSGGTLLGATVTGCGSGDDRAGRTGQAGQADRTTLRFMTAQTREKHRSLEPLIAEFMEIHPGIRIEHIKVPWDQAHSKYLTAILGGAPPDVMAIPSWWVTEFRAMGALQDLGPWVRDWPHLQGYTEQVKKLTRASMAFDGDQVFGLPTEVAVRSMFYRTEWLDEHGLAPAETREEWRVLLEKITDPSRQRYGYALRGARGGFWSWWPIAQEYAGSNAWFDEDHRCIINSPDHVAGLSYWNDLYQDGLAPPDSLNWGFNELVQGFWSGLCGTMEQDPEVVRTCLEHGLDEDRLAITVMPAGPRARVALSDGGYTSMSSASPHKDEAWTFLDWLMAPEQRLRYCRDVNMIPPFSSAMEDPAFGQGLYRSFVEMVTDPSILQNWYPNYLPEMGEFLEVRVTEEHQKMLLRRQSPQETADRLADFMTRAQEKYVDRHGPDTPRPPA